MRTQSRKVSFETDWKNTNFTFIDEYYLLDVVPQTIHNQLKLIFRDACLEYFAEFDADGWHLETVHIDLSFLTGWIAESHYPSNMLEAANANASERVE